jgi:hypothetical protein
MFDSTGLSSERRLRLNGGVTHPILECMDIGRFKTGLIAAAVAAVVAPAGAAFGDIAGFTIIPGGGAAHGDAAYCDTCDIIGVRNIQGGSNREQNLDIGAGTTDRPGNLSLNYDIGRCTQVFNGRKALIASMCPERVVFYVPVEFKQRVRASARVRAADPRRGARRTTRREPRVAP